MPKLIALDGVPRTAERRTVCLCVRCKKYKPREAFYKNSISPSGVTSYCRECYKQYNQTRRNRGTQDAHDRE